MSELYLKWMDRLYLLAMTVAGISLLVMTIVIPIGIFSRYVLNRGESAGADRHYLHGDVHLHRRGSELPRRVAHCGQHAHRPFARVAAKAVRAGS